MTAGLCKAFFLSMACVALFVGSIGSAEAADAPVEPMPIDPVLMEGEGGSAAKAYQGGQFAEAARRYQVLVDTRGASAERLYNVGTSWAQAKEMGRAIWALERAHLLEPGDEAISHNLEVLRQRIRVSRLRGARGARLTDGEPEGLSWFRLGTSWSPGGLLLLVLLANVLGWGLLAVRRGQEEGGGRDGVTVAMSLALLVALVGGVALVSRAAVVSQVRVGVSLMADTKLAPSPVVTARRDAHPDLFAGAILRVLEQRSDGWFRVRLVDGTEGWVTGDEVGLVSP